MGGPVAPGGVSRQPRRGPGAAWEGPGRSGSQCRFSGFCQPALGSLLEAASEPLEASQDALRRKKPPTWRVRPGRQEKRKERLSFGGFFFSSFGFSEFRSRRQNCACSMLAPGRGHGGRGGGTNYQRRIWQTMSKNPPNLERSRFAFNASPCQWRV